MRELSTVSISTNFDAYLQERFDGDEAAEAQAAFEDALARGELVRSLTSARQSAGLTQAAVAKRMGTTQSAVSDFESGGSDPRLSTYQRYARAVNRAVHVGFEPASAQTEPTIRFSGELVVPSLDWYFTTKRPTYETSSVSFGTVRPLEIHPIVTDRLSDSVAA